VAQRNALLPSAIFRNAERFKNGRNGTLPEIYTQLRGRVHLERVAHPGQTVGNVSQCEAEKRIASDAFRDALSICNVKYQKRVAMRSRGNVSLAVRFEIIYRRVK
jgi:hypothetical protein